MYGPENPSRKPQHAAGPLDLFRLELWAHIMADAESASPGWLEAPRGREVAAETGCEIPLCQFGLNHASGSCSLGRSAELRGCTSSLGLGGKESERTGPRHGKRPEGKPVATVHRSVASPGHSRRDLGPMGLDSVPLPRLMAGWL